MIIIKTNNSSFLYRYAGNILIEADDLFLLVTSDKEVRSEDDLETLSYKIYDKFWLEDIESIIGVEND